MTSSSLYTRWRRVFEQSEEEPVTDTLESASAWKRTSRTPKREKEAQKTRSGGVRGQHKRARSAGIEKSQSESLTSVQEKEQVQSVSPIARIRRRRNRRGQRHQGRHHSRSRASHLAVEARANRSRSTRSHLRSREPPASVLDQTIDTGARHMRRRHPTHARRQRRKRRQASTKSNRAAGSVEGDGQTRAMAVKARQAENDLEDWGRSLPLHGVVTRDTARRRPGDDAYWYLALGDEWQELKAQLVDAARNQYSNHYILQDARRRFMKSANDSDEFEFAWLTPQSPIGLHVTLDGLKVHTIEQTQISFEIRDPSRLELAPIRKPVYRTPFSSHGTDVYPLVWAFWNVELPRAYGCKHSCHISVAIYAARRHRRTLVDEDLTMAPAPSPRPMSSSRHHRHDHYRTSTLRDEDELDGSGRWRPPMPSSSTEDDRRRSRHRSTDHSSMSRSRSPSQSRSTSRSHSRSISPSVSISSTIDEDREPSFDRSPRSNSRGHATSEREHRARAPSSMEQSPRASASRDSSSSSSLSLPTAVSPRENRPTARWGGRTPSRDSRAITHVDNSRSTDHDSSDDEQADDKRSYDI